MKGCRLNNHAVPAPIDNGSTSDSYQAQILQNLVRQNHIYFFLTAKDKF